MSHPSNFDINHGSYIMQTSSAVRHIGADVAKDEVVFACAEASLLISIQTLPVAANQAEINTLPPNRIGQPFVERFAGRTLGRVVLARHFTVLRARLVIVVVVVEAVCLANIIRDAKQR